MVSSHALIAVSDLASGPAQPLTTKTALRQVARVARDLEFPAVRLETQNVPEAASVLILAADAGG